MGKYRGRSLINFHVTECPETWILRNPLQKLLGGCLGDTRMSCAEAHPQSRIRPKSWDFFGGAAADRTIYPGISKYMTFLTYSPWRSFVNEQRKYYLVKLISVKNVVKLHLGTVVTSRLSLPSPTSLPLQTDQSVSIALLGL